jgi:adenine-specific DNA methylase
MPDDLQLTLIDALPDRPPRRPPSTRYQGSKLKLLPWIWENIRYLDFDTALDAFGGTGCVSYLLKAHGKAVTYNDYLRFNHLVGTALIANSGARLSESNIESILRPDPHWEYGDFIARTFSGIYFTDDENAWLDLACKNIARLQGEYERALAYYALFQSCIIKRPYNLFHRKNLYMRTAEVQRSFGNKAAWDKSFEEHFRNFAWEASDAVFDSGVNCKAVSHDALEVPGDYDLVYIDTPYISGAGVGVDYFDFYHFLEGLTDYDHWHEKINHKKQHRPLKGERSPWSDPKRSRNAFKKLFERYAESILVVSYRNDGIPSISELHGLLREIKDSVEVAHYGQYRYALSSNGDSREILLIGQ